MKKQIEHLSGLSRTSFESLAAAVDYNEARGKRRGLRVAPHASPASIRQVMLPSSVAPVVEGDPAAKVRWDGRSRRRLTIHLPSAMTKRVLSLNHAALLYIEHLLG
jgi:hypothetical protein